MTNTFQRYKSIFSAIIKLILKHKFLSSIIIIFLIITIWLIIPPGPPFKESYSRVVYDCRGGLMRVTAAPDGQIRFPVPEDPLPRKYIAAVTACEDRRFFSHLGIDPLALVKSLIVNIKTGRRVRGGSTITMQVMRLSHPKKRSYLNKALECAGALKLSLHMSKQKILRLYAGHVPMGGNIVGVHAASWRYFGKPLSQITWAEAALFTVLPNSPSALNLAKERAKLKEKRDRGLATLLKRGLIDSMTCMLSQSEPLPSAASMVPFRAPHFSIRALALTNATIVKTTLDPGIQKRVEEIARTYNRLYASQGVKNIAALVAETQTGAVRAYAGSQDFFDTASGGQVDGVMARRSTGSLLKPYLVAKTLDRGPYVLESKLQDVPTFYGSFAPENASKEFSGLSTMRQSLIQSLNVPMVRLLYWYGVDDFYSDLRNAGFTGLFRSSEGYGLSLILGGAEASLWELGRLFCGLGNLGILRPFQIYAGPASHDTTRICSEGATWLVLSTISQLNRPGSEYYWKFFSNQISVAWKTGTSYGQKDAWAIGTNRQWTIAVWVGNFTGEGNAALGGAQSAGPVLFELFNALSDKSLPLWFTKPEYDLRTVTVCRQSGLSPSPACADTIHAEQPLTAYQTALCPYHQRILVSKSKGFSVCSRCWNGIDTVWRVKTIYPPSVRSILVLQGIKTDSLPRHNPKCPVAHPQPAIEIVYPVENVSIIVPRNLQGEHEKIVFKAEYQRPSGHLFWYLDGEFLAETVVQHNVAVDLQEGKHKLAVQDGEGETEVVRFRAFRKNE
ncbi:MAG TPA: penicillin-binding protein 1C [Chitinivibrionales bacterium]|nr:penicillin-binding protein 1C [Chitinivibrionales bacterium]